MSPSIRDLGLNPAAPCACLGVQFALPLLLQTIFGRRDHLIHLELRLLVLDHRLFDGDPALQLGDGLGSGVSLIFAMSWSIWVSRDFALS